jgi:transposase
MYIQYIKSKYKDKAYTTIVLAESYREGGKMKRRIIANLTHWPKDLVENFQKLLRGGKVVNIEELPYKQGKSFGALYVLHQMAQRVGIDQALGNEKEGRLALLQVYARLITQGSRLYIANEWAKNEAVEEILKLSDFNEDTLYANLEWLADHQLEIEKELFKKIKKKAKTVYLYDVTSSYFEGTKNELAAYGYNRDKKKGKKQIVIGLLCNEDGEPVSVEVFKGNTSDIKTVRNQLDKLRNDFGVEQVTFVGDKGMLKTEQLKDITAMQWHYITSITKEQIRTLLKQRTIQMEFFEDELMEVSLEGIRYILRRNALRANEIQRNREGKIEEIKTKIEEQNIFLAAHSRAKVSTALKRMEKLIEQKKLKSFLSIRAEEEKRFLEVLVDEKTLKQEQELDGCYVIKTDLQSMDASKEIVHERYKDLSLVESAFCTFKTGLEEIRPIHVRKEKRTRGHVFVCMLAYKILFHIWQYFKEDFLSSGKHRSTFTQQYILDCLDKINYIEYQFDDRTVKQLPKILSDDQQYILDKLKMKLPYHL